MARVQHGRFIPLAMMERVFYLEMVIPRPTAFLCAVVWLHGCATCPTDTVERQDLGVSFDLLDVAAQGGDGFALMIGEGGRVVRWGGGDETDVFEFGAGVDLRAVELDGSDGWVVGDDGFVAVTDDGARTWQILDSGTQADLRAVAPIDAGVAVVGDGVVLILQDGAWTVPPTPPNGWGELLEVVQSHPPNGTGRVFAVGRGGVVWSAQDVAGEWSFEDVGVTADLVAARDFDGEIIAIGERGTAVRRDESGTWARLNTGVKADFVDYGSYALTANGYLGVFLSSGRFDKHFRSVGAKRHSGVLMVGDGGFVSAIVFAEFCD